MFIFIIQENPDYAKFKGKSLEIYQLYYDPLYRDSVAVGDRTRTPFEFQNEIGPDDVQKDNDDEGLEGKGDSDDVELSDGGEPIFSQNSSSKRKKTMKTVSGNSSKGKKAMVDSFEK